MEKLVSLIEKTPVTPIGCSISEVKKIESAYNIILPIAYKEYLILMGHNAEEFICGDECSYERILFIQEEAKEIYFDGVAKSLPDYYFIFSTHQNYSFYCFDLNEGPDPHLFLFVNGDEIIDMKKSSFTLSQYLYNRISEHFLLS